MNDNRIKHIIREELNRLIFESIREAGIYDDDFKKKGRVVRITKNGVNVDPSAIKKPKRKYTRRPRPKNLEELFYDSKFVGISNAYKAKYIASLIRNEWYSVPIGKIITFNNRGGLNFGVENADNLHSHLKNQNTQDTTDPFYKVTSDYRKILGNTSSIEKWGKEGDYNGILPKLRELPYYLDSLAENIGLWYNQCLQASKDKTGTLRGKKNKKGNIIDGYKSASDNSKQAVNGLVQTMGKVEDIDIATEKLRKCANLIRQNIGDDLGDGGGGIDNGYDKNAGNTMANGKIHSDKI